MGLVTINVIIQLIIMFSAQGTWQDGLADPGRLLSCWSHPGCCPDRALTPCWGDSS